MALCLIDYVINNRENPDITYGDLAKRVGDDLTARAIESFLGNISEICKNNGFPLISCIVVNGDTRIPGDGFYKYFFGRYDLEFEISKYKEIRDAIISFKKWKELGEAIRHAQR